MEGMDLTPLAVRTGFALIFGRRIFLYDSGIAAMISTRRGCKLRPYFAEALHLTLVEGKKIVCTLFNLFK